MVHKLDGNFEYAVFCPNFENAICILPELDFSICILPELKKSENFSNLPELNLYFARSLFSILPEEWKFKISNLYEL